MDKAMFIRGIILSIGALVLISLPKPEPSSSLDAIVAFILAFGLLGVVGGLVFSDGTSRNTKRENEYT